MEKGKNLLEKHVDDMWKCAHCSLCKYPPLANVRSARFSQVCCSMDYGMFHAWSGGGKLNMGLSLLEGRVTEITDEMRDAIMQCTLCGACDVSCKYSTDMEVFEAIFALRRYVVEKIGPHPIQAKFAEKADEFHNPYGDPHENRQAWINDTNAKGNSESKTLFFTGSVVALFSACSRMLMALLNGSKTWVSIRSTSCRHLTGSVSRKRTSLLRSTLFGL